MGQGEMRRALGCWPGAVAGRPAVALAGARGGLAPGPSCACLLYAFIVKPAAAGAARSLPRPRPSPAG